jgi:hypothetical protein
VYNPRFGGNQTREGNHFDDEDRKIKDATRRLHIYKASDADFNKATERVYHSSQYGSYLVLSLIK